MKIFTVESIYCINRNIFECTKKTINFLNRFFCCLLLTLMAISENSTADMSDEPVPTAIGGTYSLVAEHCIDSDWETCMMVASSVEELLNKMDQSYTAYVAKFNGFDRWTYCRNATLTDYAANRIPSINTEYEGYWGVVIGELCRQEISYHNVTWQCPAGYTYDWHPYPRCLPNYVVLTLPDQPPPQVCVGNPIEVGTGTKVQVEEDISSKDIGQIFLERRYGNSNPKAILAWHNNYEKQIVIVDPTKSDSYLKKSNTWQSIEIACTNGWEEIKAAGQNDSHAQLIDGKCKIFDKNNVIKTLPIVFNKAFTSSETSRVPDAVKLVQPDGSATFFQRVSDSFFTSLDGQPPLEHPTLTTWRYTLKNGTVEEYSTEGKLITITATNGVKQTLTYNPTTNLLERVVDSKGGSLTFAYTGNQLTSVTTNDNKVTRYTYNAAGLITDVKHPDNTHRRYHYEDTRFPTYLTGITDEQGKRFATWTYDAQGRAISSEHAGGAEKTQLAFNADGSTTVTNELGKQTLYRFADIAGTRRVTSVEGQPTASCLGANQNYTYTPEGWVASKTDWNGQVTNFTYNANGQETLRSEVYGVAQPYLPLPVRETKTEWDPITKLKTKVTDPDTETTFTYDANGTLKSQTVRSLTAQ